VFKQKKKSVEEEEEVAAAAKGKKEIGERTRKNWKMEKTYSLPQSCVTYYFSSSVTITRRTRRTIRRKVSCFSIMNNKWETNKTKQNRALF